MALNERQQKFCEFFAKTGNATQAYKDAGYTPKTEEAAAVSASKLLRNPKVADEIAKIGKNARSEAVLTITEIKEFWSSVVEADEQEMPHRLKASELLVKSEGGFLDKVEHKGGIDLKVEKLERVIIDSTD